MIYLIYSLLVVGLVTLWLVHRIHKRHEEYRRHVSTAEANAEAMKRDAIAHHERTYAGVVGMLKYHYEQLRDLITYGDDRQSRK